MEKFPDKNIGKNIPQCKHSENPYGIFVVLPKAVVARCFLRCFCGLRFMFRNFQKIRLNRLPLETVVIKNCFR